MHSTGILPRTIRYKDSNVSGSPLKRIWDDLCERAWAEGRIIKGAPVAFALAVLISSVALSAVAWRIIDAFYQERIAVLQTMAQNRSAPFATAARHLKPEQRARLAEALQLNPNEKFNIQINSIPNCEECEDYAQELREFFNGIRGWSAGGSVLIFPFPSFLREGLHLTVDVNQQALNKSLLSAFEAAHVVVLPTDPGKLAGDIQAIMLVGKRFQ